MNLFMYENYIFIGYSLNCMLFFRREQWTLFSSYSCWQHLVEQTRTLSKDHAALSEIYSAHLVSKLSQVSEDIQRIYKKVIYQLLILQVVHLIIAFLENVILPFIKCAYFFVFAV